MGGLVLVLVLWEDQIPHKDKHKAPASTSPRPYTRFARRPTLFEMYCPLWASGPTHHLNLDSPLDSYGRSGGFDQGREYLVGESLDLA